MPIRGARGGLRSMDPLRRFFILSTAAFGAIAVILGVAITRVYEGSATNPRIWAILLGGFAALYALLLAVVWKTRIFSEQRDLSLQLGSLMNNVPGAVYRGFPDWTIPFIGANIEKLVGHSSGEFSSGRKPWYELVHPDDQGMLKRRVLEAGRARERGLRVED